MRVEAHPAHRAARAPRACPAQEARAPTPGELPAVRATQEPPLAVPAALREAVLRVGVRVLGPRRPDAVAMSGLRGDRSHSRWLSRSSPGRMDDGANVGLETATRKRSPGPRDASARATLA